MSDVPPTTSECQPLPLPTSKTNFGVTGTKKGATARQIEILRKLLETAHTLRHGDCVGVDEEAAVLADQIGVLHIICYPPIKERYRAFTCCNTETRKSDDYLVRDRAIVDECDWLIGCPRRMSEEWRGSGTWYTIRYARAIGRRRIIVWPRDPAVLTGHMPKPEGEIWL